MTARLANRLTQARRQRFVGRSAELELFRTTLSRDVPDFAVLHLYGPGGMDKTTLLREFAHIPEEANRTPLPLASSPPCSKLSNSPQKPLLRRPSPTAPTSSSCWIPTNCCHRSMAGCVNNSCPTCRSGPS